MGPEDENSDDFEVEMATLVRSSPVLMKTHNMGTCHIGSFVDFSQPLSVSRVVQRVFKSISVVIFQAKINLLLPFGPLAIILHYLTKKHVSLNVVYLLFGYLFVDICMCSFI